ncbi:hypothetical protein ACJX0J_035693, partial [Zea mays]
AVSICNFLRLYQYNMGLVFLCSVPSEYWVHKNLQNERLLYWHAYNLLLTLLYLTFSTILNMMLKRECEFFLQREFLALLWLNKDCLSIIYKAIFHWISCIKPSICCLMAFLLVFIGG